MAPAGAQRFGRAKILPFPRPKLPQVAARCAGAEILYVCPKCRTVRRLARR